MILISSDETEEPYFNVYKEVAEKHRGSIIFAKTNTDKEWEQDLVQKLGYSKSDLPCFHFFDPHRYFDEDFDQHEQFKCQTFSNDITIEGIEKLIEEFYANR